MDTARIEADGINALKPDLDRIAAAKTPRDLSRLFGEPGFQSPVGVYVDPDAKNPNAYIVNLVQSGLGLPDRDYYLKDDPKLKEMRAAYQAHIGRMLTLAGVADASGKAARIMALETKIAQAHWAAERTRDAIANYNPKTPRRARRPSRPASTGRRCSTPWASATWDLLQRQHADGAEGHRGAGDVAAARRLEGVPDLSPPAQPRAVPAQGDRRRELRLLRQDAGRAASSSASGGSAAWTWSTTGSARPSARST